MCIEFITSTSPGVSVCLPAVAEEGLIRKFAGDMLQ